MEPAVIDEQPQNENYRIAAKEIGDFLRGTTEIGRRFLWKNLVDGQIDADRADYLLRDSYHIGTNYGNYDLKRLLVTLTIIEHPETGTPIIGVEEGGFHAAEALIIARYLMFTQVYFHHTRRAYDYHASQTIKNLLYAKTGRDTFSPPITSANIDNYLAWDDWKVFGLLDQGKGGANGNRLKSRNHHRCVFHTSEVPTEAELDRVEEVLERLKQFRPFVDAPEKSWYSPGKSDIMVLRTAGPGSKEVVPLTSLSSVVRGLLPIQQRRIYVPLKKQIEAEKLLNS